MKKIFALLCLSYALCSCINENMDELVEEGSGVRIPFVGEFVKMTKLQFSDAVDGIHETTWSAGDAIGIFSYSQEETANDNIEAVLHKKSVGERTGIFIPQEEVMWIPSYDGELAEETIKIAYPKFNSETWVVYYPFKKGTAINPDDGCIHSSIAMYQVQDKLGDRKVCKNGIATALAIMEAGAENAKFVLSHQLAYLCVEASSTEFAGYQLHGVQMFDKNGEAALVGDFAINPIENKLEVTPGTTKPSVRADVVNHDFTSAPEKNEIYLTILPGDYTSADIHFVVTFINAEGATKTIPIDFEKPCRFVAGSLTTVNLGNITSSMAEKWPWYEVSESRDLLGRWAYGSQNTYMAMKPWQEPGTTVAANKVTIDVKPRGDFYKVREPKYYGILVSSEMGDAGRVSGSRAFLSIDGTNTIASRATPVNMNPASTFAPKGQFLPVNSDYTIDVYVLPTSERLKADGSNRDDKAGRWGSVAIFDENYQLIWSYMINGYQEGDEPKDVQYPGFAMMDRFLGVGNGNEKAAKEGWFDANSPAYFQWGRKDPLNYSSSGGLDILFYVNVHKEKLADVGDHAAVPTMRVAGYDHWYQGEARYDLWGGSNNTGDWYDPDAAGHKTVYDPCPKGYRVPDAKVFAEIKAKGEYWEFENGHKMQVTDPNSPDYHINPNSPWASPLQYESNRNHSVLAYPLGGGKYDYWPFLGYIGNGASNGVYTAGRSSSSHCHALNAWSNASTYSAMSSGLGRAACFEYSYFSSSIEQRTDMYQSYGFPVRCQKED